MLLCLALIAGLASHGAAGADERPSKVATPPSPAGITLPQAPQAKEPAEPGGSAGSSKTTPLAKPGSAVTGTTRSLPMASQGPEAVPPPTELPKGLRPPSRSITGEAAAGGSTEPKPGSTEGSSATPASAPAPTSGSGVPDPRASGGVTSAPGKSEAAPVDLQPAPVESKPVVGLDLKPGPIPELKRATVNEIIATTSKGRNAYRIADNARVIVVDMPDIRDQGLMFGRLVLFIERANAPKSRLMFLPEVQGWLKQNKATIESLTVGNNLRASELARFFNTARFQGEALTPDERQLYDWLLAWNVLQETAHGVTATAPEHILISFPQASSVAGCNGCSVTQSQRETIARHELAHAKLATDLVYQHYSEWFWSQALTPMMRERFTKFLQVRGYDPNNRDLLANEAQAFLMHTPDSTMFSAQLLGITEAELQAMRNLFESGLPPRPLATSASSPRF
ncbi:hypothetical protein MYXO_01085 [Myxococcaceae bacterium]|nr:hypothetical protein MYXO_01085 [Myxococcaceae bacterium]